MAEKVTYIREQILGDDGKEILLVFTGSPTAEAYRAIESYAGWRAARLEKRAIAAAPGVVVMDQQVYGDQTPMDSGTPPLVPGKEG